MSDTATLAFEIGTEEIPAFDLKSATEQLAELVPRLWMPCASPMERWPSTRARAASSPS